MSLKSPKEARLIGSSRNNAIVKLVEQLRALTTDQIVVLKFPQLYGRRIAQRVLYRLYKAKRLHRIRLDNTQPFIYYLRRVGQWEHTIARNWVYIWLSKQGGIDYWQTEINYRYLRPDALCGLKKGGTIEYVYVEVDRPSRAMWDKAGKYNQYFEDRGKPPGFPMVLCVTNDAKRAKKIKEGIARDNKHNLKFIVRMLDEIIQEARA